MDDPAPYSDAPPTSSGPQNPPEDGTCHFMNLPGELRNDIYSYALAEDSLKFVRFLPTMMARLQPHWRQIDPNASPMEQQLADEVAYKDDSNQLRLVSKSLYKETNGLGLRYNPTLMFVDHVDATFFIEHCKPALLEHVKIIDIQPNEVSWLNFYLDYERFKQLFVYLREFPEIEVRFHCDKYCMEDLDTVEAMAREEVWIRGTNYIRRILYPNYGPQLGTYCGDMVTAVESDGPPRIPPNFRFYFVDGQQVLRDMRAEVQTDGELKNKVLHEYLTPGGVNAYVALIDNILEHGF